MKDLLNDVHYIDINRNQIKISFRLISSYNLFKMSMNNPKAKKIIGWKPMVDIDTGLSNTYNWAVKNLLSQKN